MSDVFLIVAISALWPIVIMLLFHWAHMRDIERLEELILSYNALRRDPEMVTVTALGDLSEAKNKDPGAIVVTPKDNSVWISDGTNWHKIAEVPGDKKICA